MRWNSAGASSDVVHIENCSTEDTGDPPLLRSLAGRGRAIAQISRGTQEARGEMRCPRGGFHAVRRHRPKAAARKADPGDPRALAGASAHSYVGVETVGVEQGPGPVRGLCGARHDPDRADVWDGAG